MIKALPTGGEISELLCVKRGELPLPSIVTNPSTVTRKFYVENSILPKLVIEPGRIG